MTRRQRTSDKRWGDRLVVEMQATMRTAIHGRHVINVLDLSNGGARVATFAKHEIGQRITVQLPTLQPLSGRIVWQADYQIGCRFDMPIHPAVLDMLAKRHRSGEKG